MDPEPFWTPIEEMVSAIKGYKINNRELLDQIQELERMMYRKNYGITSFTPAQMKLDSKAY
jgi:hypothetical protein